MYAIMNSISECSLTILFSCLCDHGTFSDLPLQINDVPQTPDHTFLAEAG